MGDTDEVDDAAEARQHERATSVEGILAEVREDLGRQSYPTTSEELATTYADSAMDLPNETESIASAFDRIDDRFEEPGEAYEALVREFEDGDLVDADVRESPGERATWSGARVDEERAPALVTARRGSVSSTSSVPSGAIRTATVLSSSRCSSVLITRDQGHDVGKG